MELVWCGKAEGDCEKQPADGTKEDRDGDAVLSQLSTIS